MQGLRGRSASITPQERMQGLRGRQHLRKQPRMEYLQGLRGRQYLRAKPVKRCALTTFPGEEVSDICAPGSTSDSAPGHTSRVLVANTEPKQVYGGKQSFVSERTIKDIIITGFLPSAAVAPPAAVAGGLDHCPASEQSHEQNRIKWQIRARASPGGRRCGCLWGGAGKFVCVWWEGLESPSVAPRSASSHTRLRLRRRKDARPLPGEHATLRGGAGGTDHLFKVHSDAADPLLERECVCCLSECVLPINNTHNSVSSTP